MKPFFFSFLTTCGLFYCWHVPEGGENVCISLCSYVYETLSSSHIFQFKHDPTELGKDEHLTGEVETTSSLLSKPITRNF